MQQLQIDTGVCEFCINGRGVLRFNPTDPNVYHRFFAAGAQLDTLEEKLNAKLAALPANEDERAAQGLRLLTEYDAELKALLSGIFGGENDFDALLEGVNLASVAKNGHRVVQNLLEALAPILREGAERHLAQTAEAAERETAAARARRGAQ